MHAVRDDRSTPSKARCREMAHHPTTASRTAHRAGPESPTDRLVDQHRKKSVAAHPLIRESPNRATRLLQTAFRHREIQCHAFHPTSNCPAKNIVGTIRAASADEKSRTKLQRSRDAIRTTGVPSAPFHGSETRRVHPRRLRQSHK